jgi:uncharacterized membrane protein required for colicin V production
MNYIDIGLLVLLLLCTLIGIKRGVIKGVLQLLSFVIISILAFTFKGYLAGWLMSFMPFLNFAGMFEGIMAVNIVFYQAVSFLVIFILMYCLFSIIVALGGLFDKLLKKTIILALPDRILGGLVGFIEGIFIAFIALLLLNMIPNTTEMVFQSRFARPILERTPVIRKVVASTINATEEIYISVDSDKSHNEGGDKTNINVAVLQILIKYQLVTAHEVEELEKTGKLGIENVTFG